MTRSQHLAQIVLRLALGIGFILPVLDRLGYLGAPGSKTAAWGSWEVFVGYTHTLLPFLPNSGVSAMALIATVLEIIFGICLITGYRIRLAAGGAALLTFIFGLCMALFIGIAAPFKYPVFVFTGAAWVLSTLPVYRWSVDQLLGKVNPK